MVKLNRKTWNHLCLIVSCSKQVFFALPSAGIPIQECSLEVVTYMQYDIVLLSFSIERNMSSDAKNYVKLLSNLILMPGWKNFHLSYNSYRTKVSKMGYRLYMACDLFVESLWVQKQNCKLKTPDMQSPILEPVFYNHRRSVKFADWTILPLFQCWLLECWGQIS